MVSRSKEKADIIQLKSPEILEGLIAHVGFLPFFRNDIPGFSIEEHTPRKLWFSAHVDGPWEWKGPVIRNGNCAYGKLFNKKAAYVSMDWFPDLMNYRRSIYPLDVKKEDVGEIGRAKVIYETIKEHESLLSRDIKSLLGYNKRKKKMNDPATESESSIEKAKQGFETDMTRLQMGTWIVVADFEYQYNKQLERYGWGIARYTTPEALFEGEKSLNCEGRSPEESKDRILKYLSSLLPDITEVQILKFIG